MPENEVSDSGDTEKEVDKAPGKDNTEQIIEANKLGETSSPVDKPNIVSEDKATQNDDALLSAKVKYRDL